MIDTQKSKMNRLYFFLTKSTWKCDILDFAPTGLTILAF